MTRYKLTLTYDGTHYFGWQVQSSQLSIQALVQQALQTALRHPLHLTGSGRTDAGVHARGQTAHFDTEIPFNVSKLRLSLNALLPPDIRILEIEPVEPSFHARYSANSKIYHYYLHTDRICDPFTRKYRYQVFKKININALQDTAKEFLGQKDFTSFANEPQKGAASRDPIRHLTRLDICPIEGGLRLEFEADGFLYKMVRNITGTLLEGGYGRISSTHIRDIFAAKDRRKAFETAPPHGLFLIEVRYPKTTGALPQAPLKD